MSILRCQVRPPIYGGVGLIWWRDIYNQRNGLVGTNQKGTNVMYSSHIYWQRLSWQHFYYVLCHSKYCLCQFTSQFQSYKHILTRCYHINPRHLSRVRSIRFVWHKIANFMLESLYETTIAFSCFQQVWFSIHLWYFARHCCHPCLRWHGTDLILPLHHQIEVGNSW